MEIKLLIQFILVPTGGGLAALAEASHTADQNNSISNSVIGTEGFLKIVKDTAINKEVWIIMFAPSYLFTSLCYARPVVYMSSCSSVNKF